MNPTLENTLMAQWFATEQVLHRVARHDARLRLSILQAPDRMILTAPDLHGAVAVGERIWLPMGETTTSLTNVLYYLSLVAVLKVP